MKPIPTLLVLLCLLYSTTAQTQSIDIQKTATLSWYGNDNFQFETIEGEDLQVNINKYPWESFTLDLGEIDIYQYSKLTIELTANKILPFRIDLYDTQNEYSISQNIEIVDERISLTYDFSQGFETVDAQKSLYLLFYADPGANFSGTLKIHSLQFDATTTDIETTPTEEDYTLRAYPNPTKDLFHVNLPLHPLQYLHLYNTSGQIVFTQEISQNAGDRINIQVDYFPKGHYILQLEGESKSYTQHVIIE